MLLWLQNGGAADHGSAVTGTLFSQCCCGCSGVVTFRERGGRAGAAFGQAVSITRENPLEQALFGELRGPHLDGSQVAPKPSRALNERNVG